MDRKYWSSWVEATSDIWCTHAYTEIAVHLSSTDWPTSLKLLTVEHFYRRKSLTLRTEPIERDPTSHRIAVKNLLHHLIPICIDNFSAYHLKETYA